jgi:hypothetical protein
MASRKMRRSKRMSRRASRNRRMRGGVSPIGDTSMAAARNTSLAQGAGFLSMHKAQHGGSAAYPTSFGATLPANMVAAARTGPLDSAIGSIQGMQDGGRRRRKSRKAKKSRKSKKSKKSKESKKSRRRMRGGAHMGAPVGADSMLLPAGAERQAALHHEWADAKNPGSFAPKA